MHSWNSTPWRRLVSGSATPNLPRTHDCNRTLSEEPYAGNPHVRFCGGVVSRTRQARCCAKDEGRSFGAALWEEASNCRKLLRSKAAVVNVSVKRRDKDHVMYGLERRTQVNL